MCQRDYLMLSCYLEKYCVSCIDVFLKYTFLRATVVSSILGVNADAFVVVLVILLMVVDVF